MPGGENLVHLTLLLFNCPLFSRFGLILTAISAKVAMLNSVPITAIYVICGCRMMNLPIIASNVDFVGWVVERILGIVTIVECVSILCYSMITIARLGNT
jgi:hypothetical protein